MNRALQQFKYISADLISASAAWTIFFIYRKVVIESHKFGFAIEVDFTAKFYLSLVIIPLFWLLLYTLTGYYKDPYRKSRLKELVQTLLQCIFGVVVLFFTLLLDDEIANYRNYYALIGMLFILHFSLTFIFRFVLTSVTVYRIHNKRIGYSTLIVGSNEKALELYRELESQRKSSGFLFKGFVHINGNNGHLLKDHLPHLGHVRDIIAIIDKNDIEEVIIAIESSEHESVRQIINSLVTTRVAIKIIPDVYDILIGQVKMSSILGTPLIAIEHEIMPEWQKAVKRTFDIGASLFALTIGFPFYLIIGILVKLGSKGPVMYTHERIGRFGKPFNIYKFRTMVVDAEKAGPALSRQNDPRITPIGRFLRKSRLDELPQFYNVLIGEMSIVGPRPERRYYIDRIIEKAPHFIHLQKVRPGITSWGQVKFGYAENVDEMIDRLKYDILYIENMSLLVDFKILIHTILIVLQGSGK